MSSEIFQTNGDRSQSVKNYLTDVFGVNATRIEIDGKGSSKPVSQNIPFRRGKPTTEEWHL
jgi:flagellar motor protein MotB